MTETSASRPWTLTVPVEREARDHKSIGQVRPIRQGDLSHPLVAPRVWAGRLDVDDHTGGRVGDDERGRTVANIGTFRGAVDPIESHILTERGDTVEAEVAVDCGHEAVAVFDAGDRGSRPRPRDRSHEGAAGWVGSGMDGVGVTTGVCIEPAISVVVLTCGDGVREVCGAE